MNWLQRVWAFFHHGANVLSIKMTGVLDRWVIARVVRLTEQQDGRFFLGGGDAVGSPIDFNDQRLISSSLGQLLRGSRVELELQSSHFLFRTLELPAQAAEFLEGIVAAQIDRLTPWTAAEAAFGCSAPQKIDNGRISTVVAVGPRPIAERLVETLLLFRPASVAISTEDGEFESGRIEVFDHKAQGFLNTAKMAKVLLVLLAVSFISALSSVAAALLNAERMDAQKLETLQDIARIQSSMRNGALTPEQVAQRALQRRKFETPSMTLVLETLSSIIPDDTYATELHLIDNRLQMAGISQDAPSLIRLLEQSPAFTRATFYAPTTRSSSDPGDRFHVEAQIEPYNKVSR